MTEQSMIEIKRHSDLSEDEINALIELKKQYWPYEEGKQKEWLRDYIAHEDLHVFIWKKDYLCAYLNMVHINMIVDQEMYKMLGIGNVCVDTQYRSSGYGGLIMAVVNAYIKKNKTGGILLCKKEILQFYKKANWQEIKPVSALVAGQPYSHCIMVYDPCCMVGFKDAEIKMDREF